MRKRALLTALATYAVALPVEVSLPAVAASILSARRQQPPTEQSLPQQEQSPRPATHTIKIWTNDDLIATRTPADIYMFEKEAQASADQAAAFQSVMSCFAPIQPSSVEETQKDSDETTSAIRDAEAAVAQAKRLVAEDPERLTTRDRAELDRRTDELNKLLERLYMLQDRLRQLRGQRPAETSSAPSPEPSPQ